PNKMANLNLIKLNSIEDEYRIFWFEQLGRGANGYVYSCISKSNWQKYAMKIVSDTPKARREIEMQIHCQDSPYTVSIIDVFCNTCLSGEKREHKGDYLFIVMEYMRGGELFDIVRNYTGIFTEAHWCIIVKKLILAVKDIHDMGVIHR
ncbi:protein kinase domain-containing protein, partial [Salmonella sp. s54836]|uniref:protein kinase domain-containing protein n=1 Tax=Salmonella sp. s54836 TaxID=3159673 RepID=UPI00397F1BC4